MNDKPDKTASRNPVTAGLIATLMQDIKLKSPANNPEQEQDDACSRMAKAEAKRARRRAKLVCP